VAGNVAGVLNLNGSPLLGGLSTSLNSTFTPRYSNVRINSTLYGNTEAYRALCANEVDLVWVTRAPNEAETGLCQTNALATINVPIGYQGLVFVVNSKNNFATCLTTAEIGAIFSAKTAPKQWADVRAGFPATEIMTLLPNSANPLVDFVLGKSLPDQIAPLARPDTIYNVDDLFRAAAVQNVEGAISMLPYASFLKNTAAVNLVQIDSGNGCVTPTEATLRDASYAYSLPFSAAINSKSFARPEVRAYVWYLLSDDALTILAGQGLAALETSAITALREQVLKSFEEAERAATIIATPAPTAEATAAPTTEATTAPTVEATSEPTAEPTAAATASN
jgi:phosphate transport system substrate-binding protein